MLLIFLTAGVLLGSKNSTLEMHIFHQHLDYNIIKWRTLNLVWGQTI